MPAMVGSDRLQRATLYAFGTAIVLGIILLGFTIGPLIRPGYFRTAIIVLAGSYAILVGLIAVWYWGLKILGK